MKAHAKRSAAEVWKQLSVIKSNAPAPPALQSIAHKSESRELTSKAIVTLEVSLRGKSRRDSTSSGEASAGEAEQPRRKSDKVNHKGANSISTVTVGPPAQLVRVTRSREKTAAAETRKCVFFSLLCGSTYCPFFCFKLYYHG